MRRATCHVERALLRAIVAAARLESVDSEKPILIVERHCADDWASLTFVGVRHRFDLRIAGTGDTVATAAARLVAELPEIEIVIAGQIIAEIAVTLGESLVSDNMLSQTLIVNALAIRD